MVVGWGPAAVDRTCHNFLDALDHLDNPIELQMLQQEVQGSHETDRVKDFLQWNHKILVDKLDQALHGASVHFGASLLSRGSF